MKLKDLIIKILQFAENVKKKLRFVLFVFFYNFASFPFFFPSCQVCLINVSGMYSQPPISLPTFLLTAPRNHLLDISNIPDDRLLAAFPILIGFPLAPSPSLLTLSLLAQECRGVCSPSRKFCQWSEGCKKHDSEGCCEDFYLYFFLVQSQVRSLELSVEQLNDLRRTSLQFSIFYTSAPQCFSFSHSYVSQLLRYHYDDTSPYDSFKEKEMIKAFFCLSKRRKSSCVFIMKVQKLQWPWSENLPNKSLNAKNK